jgi:hypothetical protein
VETCVTARRGAPIAFRLQILRLDTEIAAATGPATD